MSLRRILLADEGVIGRREWWLGTAVLIAVQLAAGWLAQRLPVSFAVERGLMLFVSMALLIPFHAVNAKRFRAIGQPAWFALAGALVAGVSILAGEFLPGHPLNIPLGLALLVVILWFVAALGVYDPPPRIDPAARRA